MPRRLCLATCIAIHLPLAPSGAVAAEAEDTAAAIASQTNDFRLQQDLAPLSGHPALEAAAQDYAEQMAETGRFGHSVDGLLPAARAAAHGYEYCTVAENIGTRYAHTPFDARVLADGFVDGWKESPEHRANMADPEVIHLGVGAAQGEGGRWYVVQMFGSPLSEAIRFEVANEGGEPIEYLAGGTAYSLPPGALRAHVICGSVELEIASRGAAEPFAGQAEHGARYTVGEDGQVRRNGPQQ